MYHTFLICFLLSIFMGCGGHNNDDPAVGIQEEEINFETRLNETLLIAGESCLDGEVLIVDGITFQCVKDGQMFFRIDDINRCRFGSCTSTTVPAFLGFLTPVGSNLYEIRPGSPLSSGRQSVLDKIFVRESESGSLDVIFR